MTGVSGLSLWCKLRQPACKLLEDRAQARRGLRQFFRQHAHLADDRHEVGVAVPARHEVHVQVIDDARAGRTAEVDADVDALAAE